jgi:hypothetical protein
MAHDRGAAGGERAGRGEIDRALALEFRQLCSSSSSTSSLAGSTSLFVPLMAVYLRLCCGEWNEIDGCRTGSLGVFTCSECQKY